MAPLMSPPSPAAGTGWVWARSAVDHVVRGLVGAARAVGAWGGRGGGCRSGSGQAWGWGLRSPSLRAEWGGLAGGSAAISASPACRGCGGC